MFVWTLVSDLTAMIKQPTHILALVSTWLDLNQLFPPAGWTVLHSLPHCLQL